MNGKFGKNVLQNVDLRSIWIGHTVRLLSTNIIYYLDNQSLQ